MHLSIRVLDAGMIRRRLICWNEMMIIMLVLFWPWCLQGLSSSKFSYIIRKILLVWYGTTRHTFAEFYRGTVFIKHNLVVHDIIFSIFIIISKKYQGMATVITCGKISSHDGSDNMIQQVKYKIQQVRCQKWHQRNEWFGMATKFKQMCRFLQLSCFFTSQKVHALKIGDMYTTSHLS